MAQTTVDNDVTGLHNRCGSFGSAFPATHPPPWAVEAKHQTQWSPSGPINARTTGYQRTSQTLTLWVCPWWYPQPTRNCCFFIGKPTSYGVKSWTNPYLNINFGGSGTSYQLLRRLHVRIVRIQHLHEWSDEGTGVACCCWWVVVEKLCLAMLNDWFTMVHRGYRFKISDWTLHTYYVGDQRRPTNPKSGWLLWSKILVNNGQEGCRDDLK